MANRAKSGTYWPIIVFFSTPGGIDRLAGHFTTATVVVGTEVICSCSPEELKVLMRHFEGLESQPKTATPCRKTTENDGKKLASVASRARSEPRMLLHSTGDLVGDDRGIEVARGRLSL